MENRILAISKHNFEKTLNQNLKLQSSTNKLDELKKVANQFESIFVNQVLKQARQGKIAEGILNSEAEETFNSLIDQEYSKVLSEKSNFGIAEALYDQFKNHVRGKRK